MPKGKKGMKRAYGRRKPYRKMKLMRGARLANYNAQSFKTTATWIADVKAMSSNGGLTNYVYFDTSALTGVANIANTEQFALYRKIFDQYRITGVTMTWKPKVTQTTVFDTTAAPVAPDFDNVVWSSFDVDSPIASSERAIQVNRATRKYQFTKSFKRSFRYKYPNGTWLDTFTDYSPVDPITKQPNPAIKMTGLYAHFGIFALNVPAGPLADPFVPVPVGQVQITYHVVFRGQSFSNVGYDPENDIIVLGTNEPDMRPLSDITKHTSVQTVSVSGLTNSNTDPIV